MCVCVCVQNKDHDGKKNKKIHHPCEKKKAEESLTVSRKAYLRLKDLSSEIDGRLFGSLLQAFVEISLLFIYLSPVKILSTVYTHNL